MNLSTAPLAAGWYTEVLVCTIFNSSRKAAKSEEVSCSPFSFTRHSGFPCWLKTDFRKIFRIRSGGARDHHSEADGAKDPHSGEDHHSRADRTKDGGTQSWSPPRRSRHSWKPPRERDSFHGCDRTGRVFGRTWSGWRIRIRHCHLRRIWSRWAVCSLSTQHGGGHYWEHCRLRKDLQDHLTWDHQTGMCWNRWAWVYWGHGQHLPCGTDW